MLKSPLTGPARRTVAEPHIVEMLLVRNWPFELRRGHRARAEAEVRAALNRLVALGLPYVSDTGSGRLFDLAEVINFLVWAGIHLGEETLQRQVVVTTKRMVGEPHGHLEDRGDDAPPPAGTLPPRRFAVTLRRRFNLQGHARGRRLRLRLPVPVEDTTLCDLSLDLLPEAGVAMEASSGHGRIDVITAAPPQREVTVGAALTFTARPFPGPARAAALAPADRELYTRPHEGLLRISPRIAALARTVAEGAGSAEATVARFWNFFLREFAIGYVHYDLLDREWPLHTGLESGWFDCVTGSALLAAMCRAQGIPARTVSGYCLYPSAPCFHAWFEVWFDGTGWRPIDLFGWSLTMNRAKPGGWRDHLYGHVDYRMALERPPLVFAGTGSVPVPRAWDMVCYAEGRGAAFDIREAGTETLVYSEYVDVTVIGDQE